jgi:hypothetical protein
LQVSYKFASGPSEDLQYYSVVNLSKLKASIPDCIVLIGASLRRAV